MRLYVYAMSAAVSGFPSDQVTPVRMWNVYVRPWLVVSHDVARPGSGDMSLSE